MARNRKKRKNMQQVYFRRRLGAVIIMALILLFVFNRCRSKPETNTDQDPVNNQQQQQDEQSFVIPAADNPNNTLDPLDDDADLDEMDLDTDDDRLSDSDDNQTADTAIKAQIEEMEDDYRRLADIYYIEESDTINFEIKGKLKESVAKIFEDKGETADYDRWDEFKDMVIKSSETISEEVETGVILKAINQGGPTESILSVKDGIETFDLVKD